MGATLLAPTEGWWPWPPNGGLWAPWLVKLKFGALFPPPCSSFGGLVAFCQQGGPFRLQIWVTLLDMFLWWNGSYIWRNFMVPDRILWGWGHSWHYGLSWYVILVFYVNFSPSAMNRSVPRIPCSLRHTWGYGWLLTCYLEDGIFFIYWIKIICVYWVVCQFSAL